MTLSAALLLDRLQRGGTASAVLCDWCLRRFGPGVLEARILEDRPIEDGKRHRRVQLLWQDVAVSEAGNIYLPENLPGDVRHRLLDTTVPFGVLLGGEKVVRRTISARLLPEGEPFVLEVRAALTLPEQGDVAFVHEFYHRSLLG